MFDVQTVWGTLQQYMGNGLFLVSFAIALCVCIKKAKGEKKKELAWICLLLVVLVYNDITKKILGKLTSDATYYRFFWMVPVVLILAYVVTEAFFSSKHWIDIVAICVAFVVFFQATGTNVMQKEALHVPSNKYNLSEDLLQISMVIEDKKDKARPVVAFDSQMLLESRIYDPSILWAVSRDAYFHPNEKKYADQKRIIETVDQGAKENPKKLKKALKKRNVDYLVIQSAFDMDAYLEDVGCEAVGKTTSYTIYVYNGER